MHCSTVVLFTLFEVSLLVGETCWYAPLPYPFAVNVGQTMIYPISQVTLYLFLKLQLNNVH